MKANLFLWKSGLLAWTCFLSPGGGAFLAAGEPAAEGKLVVHEWGTMTMLNGSDGRLVPWYLPQSDVAELPEFVERFPGASKVGAAQPWAVRMETPVIYFYPGAPMEVSVEAGMREGVITDVFPAALADMGNAAAKWRGRLLPPGHDPLPKVPPVLERGTHYQHARAVPDAWLFEGSPPLRERETFVKESLPLGGAGKDGTISRGPQVDHFVFYRGAGLFQPRLGFAVSAGELRAFGAPEFWADLFVLNVDGERAGWNHVVWHREDELPVLKIPEASAALDECESALEKALHPALVARGLSVAEASAMIATWREAWFREPGLRVFAPLPRTWIDEAVPLRIEPRPARVERVYLGRWEIFTQDRELQGLTILRKARDESGEAGRGAWAGLQLGRFEPGFVQRLINLEAQHLRVAHSRLLPRSQPVSP